MGRHEEETERLFSYGTLRQEAVQLATFGRRLEGERDALVGYRVTLIRIQDPRVVATSGPTHHRNVVFTGNASDLVDGAVFAVTKKELDQADAYERAATYKRVAVELRSGIDAWVYVSAVE